MEREEHPARLCSAASPGQACTFRVPQSHQGSLPLRCPLPLLPPSLLLPFSLAASLASVTLGQWCDEYVRVLRRSVLHTWLLDNRILSGSTQRQSERARFPFERVGVTGLHVSCACWLAVLCTLLDLSSVQLFGFPMLDPKNAHGQRQIVWSGGVVIFSLFGLEGLVVWVEVGHPCKSCDPPLACLAKCGSPFCPSSHERTFRSLLHLSLQSESLDWSHWSHYESLSRLFKKRNWHLASSLQSR